MPPQFGKWRKVEDNPRGYRVRRVLKNGIQYQQWDNKDSKLVRYNPRDSSPSESGEETEEADPQAPRSSISRRDPGAGRHALDEYFAAATAGPAAEETMGGRHYDLTTKARSRSRPPPEVAEDANAARHVDLDSNARSRSRPLHSDEPNIEGASTEKSRHTAHLTKFVSAPLPAAPPHPEQIFRRSATAPAAFKSSLPDNCYNFAGIPRGNLSACRAFMIANPEIVESEHQDFLLEAAKALQADLIDHPESCIEKAILISECAELSKRGMREYLDDLVRKPQSQGRRDFDKKYIDTFNEVKRRADAQTAALVSSAAGAQAAAHASQPGYLSNVARRSLGPNPTPGQIYRHPSSGPADPPSANLASRAGQRREFEDQVKFRRSATGTQPPFLEPTKRTHTDTTAGLAQNLSRLSVQPDLRGQSSIPSATEIEIKGTEGDEEKLDPRYKKRRDAREFFSEGRVFSMLWHENVGMSEIPGKNVQFVITKGRYGERIFSHTRRMVVVRQRDGYCWCIGINTYGGQGVAKRGMKLADRQAHSIIHMSNVKPTWKADEHDMIKQPIAVVMAPKQELNSMSRLNFGQPHTVAWNVKVMNVGKVHEKSMPYLTSYWRNEMGVN